MEDHTHSHTSQTPRETIMSGREAASSVRALLHTCAAQLARAIALRGRAQDAMIASERLLTDSREHLRVADVVGEANQALRDDLARAVRALAREMRDSGAPPEEFLVTVKEIVAAAARTELASPHADEVVADATQRAIDAYYSVG